jgi:hypothetical protein
MTGGEIALGASNLLLGTAVGAGVNQSIFVMPRWFESPPESLSQVRDRGPAKFWIPLQAASTVALVSAFALNRADAGRRRLLAIALGFYVGTWVVTGAYFAPEIMRLSKADGELPASEIARRGKRWLKLSWGRQLAMAVAWAATAAALGRRRSVRSLGRLGR